MKKFTFHIYLTLMLLITFCHTPIISQPSVSGTVEGTVQDSTSGTPMGYANVVIFTESDSTQITGTITDSTGYFELENIPTGQYYLRANFIGYNRTYISDIEISSDNPSPNVGVIALPQATLQSDEVVVQGEQPAVTYEVDRKVVDVSKMETSFAGNASDILENLPSVTVDIEGNVSLRGSQSFTVLIDGRPTVLDAQQALQQIPASTIADIELITNPSAKYDPEGTAGIINIITKENALYGMSGLVNANGGLNDKYGGEATVNYRNDQYTATIGADHNRRLYDGDSIQRSRTSFQGTTSFTEADGTSNRGRISSGLRAAIDYNLTEDDIFTVQARVGRWGFESDERQFYEEWTASSPNDRNLYTSLTDSYYRSTYYALNFDYLRKFQGEGHELNTELQLSYDTSESRTTDELRQNPTTISDGRMTSEAGPENEVEFEMEYTLPFTEESRFEAGIEGEIESSEETVQYFTYNTDQSDYIEQPQYENDVAYGQREISSFALYQGKLGDLGYQAGIRGEYTFRDISLIGGDQVNSINRFDYFPTFHMSYEISGIQQAMASYSRRIDRPRGYWLEPFNTREDAYNIRAGNPGLIPEYIDSYELGYQTEVFGSVFSAEGYYRVNHNKIERIQSVYAENVTLHRPENIGTDYSFGTDLSYRIDLFDFWQMNLMGNVYHYRIEGQLGGQNFDRESYNWNARINNSIDLWENGSMQLQGNYRSPSVSAQGDREGYFVTDLSFRQDFLDRSLSAILQVRDVFGTREREYVSEGQDFYRYEYQDREAPVIMMTLRLNINNFDEQQQGGQNGGGMGGGGEF